MFEISAETFAENCDYTIKVNKKHNKSVLWIRMINIQKNVGVKNIFDLVGKETKGKFKTDNPTEQQIKKYKRNASELIDNERFVYAYEYIIIPVIMTCRIVTPEAIKFKSGLGIKQHDIILRKEQSVIS